MPKNLCNETIYYIKQIKSSLSLKKFFKRQQKISVFEQILSGLMTGTNQGTACHVTLH